MTTNFFLLPIGCHWIFWRVNLQVRPEEERWAELGVDAGVLGWSRVNTITSLFSIFASLFPIVYL